MNDIPDPPLRLALFVAGMSPNSRAARANLKRALEEMGRANDFAIEVIDVLKRPDVARSAGVLVTPTLTRADRPGQRIEGDLSAQAALKAFLA